LKNRKRFLLVTRNLPPLLGGMERLNLEIARTFGSAGDLTVIGPRGCGEYLPIGTHVEEIPVRPLWRFLLKLLWVAQSVRWKKEFDWVLAGSGLTVPAALMAARGSMTRAAAYLHGLDIVAKHTVYRAIWLPNLRRLDLVLANSANTAELAKQVGIPGDRIRIIHPGTALPGENEGTGRDFRESHGLGNRPILLAVGRLTARKGLEEFICQALPKLALDYPDAVLVVIGGEAIDAISGDGNWRRAGLLELARRNGVSGNLKFLGSCSDAQLHDAYRAANVHVFPGIEIPGDVEGFGMVAIEAAARGLPTVAFAVGGIPDAVSDGVSGKLVSPGDYQELVRQVDRILAAAGQAPYAESAKKFAASFSWMRFEQELLNVIMHDRIPEKTR